MKVYIKETEYDFEFEAVPFDALEKEYYANIGWSNCENMIVVRGQKWKLKIKNQSLPLDQIPTHLRNT